MSEIYFSVDIEADGPYPGDYSMSSIGVVACAIQANDGTLTMLDIDEPENQFYVELAPISDEFDERAAGISGLDRNDLIESGEQPANAMIRLNSFVRTIAVDNMASPKFAAWPAPFDWFWTYWYLMKFAGESAFGFSGAINMKDVYAVKAGIPFKKVGKRSAYKNLGITPRPHTHNALDDALEQAVLWQAILKWKSSDES